MAFPDPTTPGVDAALTFAEAYAAQDAAAGFAELIAADTLADRAALCAALAALAAYIAGGADQLAATIADLRERV